MRHARAASLTANHRGDWLSLAERCLHTAEVTGSNPVSPTAIANTEGEKVEIRRIQWVDSIREVWPNEDLDFTPWLKENLDVFEESLGFEFERDSIQREERTGNSASSLKVDLVGTTDSGQSVIIENQFGSSDHAHLGKVLTYTAAFEADIAIWIVEEPRSEHVKAIEWLNDSGRLTAYMFKIQVVRIDDSSVAPLLTLIIGPSSDEIAESKREMTEAERSIKAFNTELLKHAKTQTDLYAKITASKRSPSVSYDKGAYLRCMVLKESNSVDLWIDGGKGKEDWNEEVYRQLFSNKDAIEESFGHSLEWKDNVRRGRKVIHTCDGGWADQENWQEIIEDVVDRTVRLEGAIRRYLKKAIKRANAASSS